MLNELMTNVKYRKLALLIVYIISNLIYLVMLNAENEYLLKLDFATIITTHFQTIVYYFGVAVISIIIGIFLVINMRKTYNESLDISMLFFVIYALIIIVIIILIIVFIQNPILRIIFIALCAGGVLVSLK